ncbi:hypothetical protein CEUSTIGMA_g7104.t1 [Chlamydomonas eustigma]|uniref:Uncharacterized protein n=1 Tax=Chlamydomonas eustigma TaxID=1157962 RepID=A0A250X9A3_9CHLO|nr:hypothetical protein CEUSTIGMA_g7104.t1 [Chlamydomonas eustigma]|eukprot:GAX79663.1 hypothetical protein CEUSTIGMA_g7104.t1 [Chlamydomonas eustigma]
MDPLVEIPKLKDSGIVEPEDTLLMMSDAHKERKGLLKFTPLQRWDAVVDAGWSNTFAMHSHLVQKHQNQLREEAKMVTRAKKLGEELRTKSETTLKVKEAMKNSSSWVSEVQGPSSLVETRQPQLSASVSLPPPPNTPTLTSDDLSPPTDTPTMTSDLQTPSVPSTLQAHAEDPTFFESAFKEPDADASFPPPSLVPSDEDSPLTLPTALAPPPSQPQQLPAVQPQGLPKTFEILPFTLPMHESSPNKNDVDTPVAHQIEKPIQVIKQKTIREEAVLSQVRPIVLRNVKGGSLSPLRLQASAQRTSRFSGSVLIETGPVPPQPQPTKSIVTLNFGGTASISKGLISGPPSSPTRRLNPLSNSLLDMKTQSTQPAGSLEEGVEPSPSPLRRRRRRRPVPEGTQSLDGSMDRFLPGDPQNASRSWSEQPMDYPVALHEASGT